QYNRAFEIQFFNSFLIEKHRDMFERAMPLCLERTGANLWLRKTLHLPELDRIQVKKERTGRQSPRNLDLTRPEDIGFLGEGWYEPEADHCWMTQASSLQIGGPRLHGQCVVFRAVSPLEGSLLSSVSGGLWVGCLVLGFSWDVVP